MADLLSQWLQAASASSPLLLYGAPSLAVVTLATGLWVRSSLRWAATSQRPLEPSGTPIIKTVLAFLLVSLGKRRRPPTNAAAVEALQRETIDPATQDRSLPEFTDNHYFNGRSFDGRTTVWCRLGWREHGVETFVFVDSPATGPMALLPHAAPLGAHSMRRSMEEAPLTVPVFSRPPVVGRPSPFVGAAAGLTMECVEPMRRWRARFDGHLCSERRARVAVRFALEWEAASPVLLFDDDGDNWTVARFLARDQWNKEYFQRLQRLHQKHYEQGGVTRGTIEWQDDSGAWQSLTIGPVPGFRTHTFGPRDWTHFRNWVFHIASFEDGRYLTMTVIRRKHFPLFMAGFISGPSYKTPIVLATSLEAMGRQMRSEYRFVVQPRGAAPIEIVVRVDPEKSSSWEFGAEVGRPSILEEGMAAFEMQGVHGIGLAEWGFRKKDMLPPKFD